MRLLRLNLEHYRMHQQLELSFAAGLNVLEGANESGKSTLAEAVHRALFLPVRSSGAACTPPLGDYDHFPCGNHNSAPTLLKAESSVDSVTGLSV